MARNKRDQMGLDPTKYTQAGKLRKRQIKLYMPKDKETTRVDNNDTASEDTKPSAAPSASDTPATPVTESRATPATLEKEGSVPPAAPYTSPTPDQGYNTPATSGDDDGASTTPKSQRKNGDEGSDSEGSDNEEGDEEDGNDDEPQWFYPPDSESPPETESNDKEGGKGAKTQSSYEAKEFPPTAEARPLTCASLTRPVRLRKIIT